MKHLFTPVHFIKIIFCLLLFGPTAPLTAIEPEFPLITGIAHFPFSDHRVASVNRFHLSLALNYSNIYSYDHLRENINDFEMAAGVLSLRYGLTPRLTLECHLRRQYIYGGFLDDVIMEFHNFWGLKQGGRYDFPTGQSRSYLKDVFDYKNPTSATSPLIVGAVAEIASWGRFSLNGRVSAGLPLFPKTGFSSPRPSLTLGLILLWENGPLSAFWATHGAFFTRPGALEKLAMDSHIIHSEVCFKFHQWFLGFTRRTSPFKNGELANGATQIYLGFGFLKRFEFALVEEFPPMDTTPDVSFYLKIRLL